MSPFQKEMFPPKFPEEPNEADLQEWAGRMSGFTRGLPSMKNRPCQKCGEIRHKMELVFFSDGTSGFYCWDCSLDLWD